MTAAELVGENVVVKVQGAELNVRDLAEVAQALAQLALPYHDAQCRLQLIARGQAGSYFRTWSAQVAICMSDRLVAYQSPAKASFTAALAAAVDGLQARLDDTAEAEVLRAIGMGF